MADPNNPNQSPCNEPLRPFEDEGTPDINIHLVGLALVILILLAPVLCRWI